MRSTSWWSRLSAFERLSLAALALVVAAAWFVPMSALESAPLCLFRVLSGWRCPGCGMGHALLSAFRGDLAASWAWHPLGLPLAGAWVLYFLAKPVMSRPVVVSGFATWVVLAGVLIVHAVR